MALLALWAFFIQLCISSPIPRPEISLVEWSKVKRSESGSLMGGVNFPDPCIVQYGSYWYAFATRTVGSGIHIQVAQSSDFDSWSLVYDDDGSQKDALPDLPPWVDSSSPNTWAPDVIQIDGQFVMYFSATSSSDSSKHCIGAATATSVTGPYTPISSSALICPLSQGGAIDASGYYDQATGNRYITYKIDGNSIGYGGACGNDVAPYVSTAIQLQQVSASDGVTLQGNASEILDNVGASDQGIVEAPSLVKSGSYYILFFSSGCFTQSTYTVNYATATSVTGPYTRAASPLFSTGTDGLTAPGGMDVFSDGEHMLFHAKAAGSVRALYNAVVRIDGGVVTA
ncbi:hypothetical protein B0A50_03373 [Salinomyces thailandicus]|uniref:Uncharacterized protein n=1 Tax=Salinomyces thailandicus TaxID=706561 RepID=A0A4U0U1X4_9PEZI|nr:hypothetical protein B0A50_03373 [Salinomyces thailandica]